MNNVEKILKNEWGSLFWEPHYNSELIKTIFKDKHPGDITARHQKLHIAVLKDEGAFLGFVTYYQANATTGHIELLALDTPYIGKGYGKKLVNYVQQWCISLAMRHLELYVYTRNPKAISFYHHLGFNTKKTYPGFLLLSKPLLHITP